MKSRAPRTRVMEIIGSLHIGGAERVVANIVRGLDPSRFEVTVCCTRELGEIAEELSAEGFDIRLSGPLNRRLRYLTPLALWRQVAGWKPDIVHTHGLPAMLHTGPLAMVRQLPVWLHTFHYGNFGAEMNRSMRAERVLCRRASRLIAVSDAQRLSLIRFYGIPESRITTVINGVADNPFADEAGAIRQRKIALGLDAEAIVVGCLAVLSEQKGIRYLLEAADRILRHDERVQVLVVGGGPLEESLRKQAASISETRIVFTGWRQDAAELLPVFDVFVMSSLWEAMPMVLLESMAARRPIVVTDVGENRKIVDGGRCGLVIPPRDPDAIASAVISLLERPEEAGALAARAQARFRERYTIRAMVTAYEALFDEFLLPRSVVAMVG